MIPKDVIASVHAALSDVATERLRQVLVKGLTASHDDAYVKGELVDLALSYAVGGKRDDLVKATAVLVAEIERRDRIALREPKQ